jgi:hypothetical protein
MLPTVVTVFCVFLGFCAFQCGQAAGPPPVILIHPSDEAVHKGEAATFSVVASSVTTMTYQWYFGGNVIRSATASTLTITNASPGNAGKYKVSVKNAGGTVTSQTAELNILNTPPVATVDSYIALQDTVLSVAPNGVLSNDSDIDGQSLTASVVSGPSHGTLILNADGSFSYAPASGYEGLDDFQYRAHDGTASSQAAIVNLIVLCPPSIELQPSNQVIYAGQHTSFAARATGSTPMQYQWYRNDIPISEATNKVLVVSNALPEWSGDRFVMVAQNAGASTTSSVAVLTVVDTALRLQPGWVQRYNGTASQNDYATALALDAQGNILQTGYAKESLSGNLDFVTLKYDRSGNLLWRAVYDGGDEDRAVAMVVDPEGNTYMTGASKRAPSSAWDYATVKYGPDGTQLWVMRYDGVVRKDDLPSAICLRAEGGVVVTGASKGEGDRFTFLTIAYDGEGRQAWLTAYTAPKRDEDRAVSVASDKAGNIYVTGQSKGEGTDFDYATVKYSSSGEQLWAQRYNGSASKADIPVKVLAGDDGFVTVTGTSEDAVTKKDYATIRYDSNGVPLWIALYDDPWKTDDFAGDMLVDREGNVIVTGWSSSPSAKLDFATVKYSPAGQQLWASRYSEADEDRALALAIDQRGDIYVTGTSKVGTGFDIATVKLMGKDGTMSAPALHNSGGNTADTPVSIAVDSRYYVYVAGQGFNSLDYTLLQYQSSYLAPVITNLSAYDVELSSATVKAVVDSQGSPTAFHFRYGTTSNYETTTEWVTLPPGASPVAASLTGLTSGTLYHYSIVSSNAAGITISEGATFSTKVGAPSGSTLAATEVTDTTAVLNAEVLQQILALTCYFEYGETTQYGSVSPSTLLPAILGLLGSGDLLHVATPISGLAPGKVYHYRLVVTGLGGTTYGPDASFATKIIEPVQVAGTLKPADVGGTTERHMQLRFSGSPGLTCMVQTSTNMVDWSPAAPAVEVSPGVYEFIDPSPATHPRCFYRLRSQ